MIDKELETPEVVEQTQPEQPEVTEQAAPAIDEQTEENYKTLRAKTKKLTKERDDYARRLQEIESSRQPVQEKPVEQETSYDPDAYVEGKHLSKVEKELKRLQEEVVRYQRQSTESAAEVRLKNEFPDFDAVVNDENIQLLAELEPALAETIRNSSSNLYSKAVTAYKMIKKLGLAPDATMDADKRKIAANMAKPKPLASIKSQSPLSQAASFSETISADERKAYYAEMLESRKRVG